MCRKPKATIMPADLPPVSPVVAIPYFRVIAFVAGGGFTLAILMLLVRATGN